LLLRIENRSPRTGHLRVASHHLSCDRLHAAQSDQRAPQPGGESQAARDIAYVGCATQAPYDPFLVPDRARREEFGDLLAEGLFALFEGQPLEMDYRPRLESADTLFWEEFIAARRSEFSLIGMGLEVGLENGTNDAYHMNAAIRSVDAATDQLSRLSPEIYVDYLHAWAEDLVEWEQTTQRTRAVGTTVEAVDVLGLRQWYSVGDRTAATATAWT
jgi:hypothetical protein